MASGNIMLKNYTRQMTAEKPKQLNEKLILELVPTVKRMSIRIKNRIYSDMTVDDIFSIAIVALIEAASKIDDSDPDQFQHYLLKRAKGAVYDELRKEDTMSRGSREFLDKYQRCFDELSESLDREPTSKEVADTLRLTEEKLFEEIRKTETMSFYSLETWFAREDGSSSFDDVVAGESPIGEDKLGDLDVQGEILKSLDKLSFQERLVLSFYYYDELNFKEIAQVMGVSIGRISQLHSKAILSLKKTVAKNLTH